MSTPPLTVNELGSIFSGLADHLATAEWILDYFAEVDPLRRNAIIAWLTEHGVDTDIDLIMNFDQLTEALKTEWQQAEQ